MEYPWVRLRSFPRGPLVYRKLIASVGPDAQPGGLVRIFDRDGEIYGHGDYNPASQIALRVLSLGPEPPGEAFWRSRIAAAAGLRRGLLRLDECTEAYRVIHAEADGLSGLIVDRFGPVLSIELFSLGMLMRIRELIPLLYAACGTQHAHVRMDERAAELEGVRPEHRESIPRDPDAPTRLRIREHGVRFHVDFRAMHKTGFFCDQRDNRMALSRLAKDATVLDVCCYSGGFGLYAAALGRAKTVTCVDLDDDALELARSNANLNGVQIRFAKSDAFIYLRQMQQNDGRFDIVILDPPKFIVGRREDPIGEHKYSDLNMLGMSLVRPGGLLLTCSCSGGLDRASFLATLRQSARRARRSIQILAQTGAASDHPVDPAIPETEYLKAVWLRVGE